MNVNETNKNCVQEFVKDVFGVETDSNEVLEKGLNTLKDLSDREERVVLMKYGLADGKPKSLAEIASEFGVTREMIRQVLSKAIIKLHHPSRMPL